MWQAQGSLMRQRIEMKATSDEGRVYHGNLPLQGYLDVGCRQSRMIPKVYKGEWEREHITPALKRCQHTQMHSPTQDGNRIWPRGWNLLCQSQMFDYVSHGYSGINTISNSYIRQEEAQRTGIKCTEPTKQQWWAGISNIYSRFYTMPVITNLGYQWKIPTLECHKWT